jgi:hypothetical protein
MRDAHAFAVKNLSQAISTRDFTTYAKESYATITYGRALVFARQATCPHCGFKPRKRKMKVAFDGIADPKEYVVSCLRCGLEIKRFPYEWR